MLLCALVLLIMFAETGFWKFSLSNLLPKVTSQSAQGKIKPGGTRIAKPVLIGHLDTARAPIFFHIVLMSCFNHILISVGALVLFYLLLFLFGSIF